jgi:hypothetical protein
MPIILFLRKKEKQLQGFMHIEFTKIPMPKSLVYIYNDILEILK